MKRFPTPASGWYQAEILLDNYVYWYSLSFSVHKRKVHNIGKPIDEVTPRGPNLKLRKRYQQMQNQEEEFDKLTTPKRMKLDSEDEDGEGLEDLDLENEEDIGTKTIQVGDKNFTFSFS